MHDKKQLRETMLKKRLSVSGGQAEIFAKSIARHYADHPVLAFARSCGCYMAMRGEADVMPILAFMQFYKRGTALPRITHKSAPLSFHRWQAGDALERHTLGMLEPLASAEPVIPEIILTPLLAFDASGHRLGYGGGYYDRTMTALRDTPRPPLFIGVAYSWQEVSALPLEEHDVKLDGILTELGVSLFP